MNPLSALKLYFLLSKDVQNVKMGASMNNIKSWAWWEHLAVMIGTQLPTLASVALGASNPITLGLGLAGVIAHGVVALSHAHVTALQAVNDAAQTASAATVAIQANQGGAAQAIAAAQAVADSLTKIVAALPPAPAPAK